MSFVYSFDVGKMHANFNVLSEDAQASIEQNIAHVIYDSFVIPADEDYLMARLLAQKGLDRGFFWAASQALEKYLKAYLLMNDIDVRSKGHSLMALFDEASALNADISGFSLSRHPDVKIDAEIASHVKNFSARDYILELSVHGSPANRYNASGVVFNTGHLFALDAFVYRIRKIIGVIGIEDSFKCVGKDLIEIFYNNNYNYAPISVKHSAVPSSDFPVKHSMNATRLDYLRKNKSHQTCSIALEWLGQKMKL